MFLLGTLLSANAQVPSYVPSNGLVSWWPFSGNANDQSGNGNNATVNGPTLTQDRKGTANAAYIFDGVNDWMQVSNSSSLNPSEITLAAWCNPFAYNASDCSFILGKGGNQNQGHYDLNIFSNNQKLRAVLGNNLYAEAKNQTKLNNWIYLTATIKGTTLKVYINGLLDSVVNLSQNNNLGSNTEDLTFGRMLSSNYPYFFNGVIDDIGIWSRALSDIEIKKMYLGCNKSITQQPINQGMFNGIAIFTCATNDTLVNYQWQSDLGMGWTNLSNAGQYSGTTTNSLQISNVTSTNNNQKFRCILKGDCLTDTTNEAALKVWGLGIEDEIVDELIVYPTPSSTQVIIDNGNYSTMGIYTAKIVNTSGQQVFQSVINQQQFVIDANTMGGAGVYTLYITDANNKVVGVKKIVLQ